MMEEIESIAKKIKERRILLQVPEGLKTEVPKIVEILERHGKEVIVDIDPTYGACDLRINEMKAVNAEAILHIGHAPMFNYPNVYYVEWRRDADIEAVERSIKEIARGRRFCLATTANLRWVLEKLKNIEGAVVGKGSWRIPLEGVVLGCDTSACDVDADINIFVGDGYFHPLAIWVNTKRPTFVVYPDGRWEEVSFERLVRKRLALLGSISGKRVGILVSSKIGQNRWPLARELYDLAKEKGYIPRIYVSDYIDPLYLLGLEEDFFVYTGCPRVPIDDAERYDKPLLTPEEFLYLLGVVKEYKIGWITRVPRGGSEE